MHDFNWELHWKNTLLVCILLRIYLYVKIPMPHDHNTTCIISLTDNAPISLEF
jgi:hypothetical protein